MRQAAVCASLLIALQQSAFDNAMIYDARPGIGLYSPLFDPSTLKPRRAYWALCNFNELYRLGHEVKVGALPDGVVAIAATDGKGLAKIFWANIGEQSVAVAFSAPGWELLTSQITDDWRVNTVVAPLAEMPPDSFGVLTFRSVQ